MRDLPLAGFQCFQLQLPGEKSSKRRNQPRGPRATSSAYSLSNRHGSRSSIRKAKSSCSCSNQGSNHNCVSMFNSINSKDSQQILIGSALRRPHATSYSPLDYQTMPDVGKTSNHPYRSQSARTVYQYANRPMSAAQAEAKHGKQTKSSILRNKSLSCNSLTSKTSCCSKDDNSRPTSANKRLCEIRNDYRFFKKGPSPKQVPPHGQSLHSFLTGARYNSTRYLDSRALSKLGVYIPKGGLQTFFVQDPPVEQHDDDEEKTVEYDLNMSDTLEEEMDTLSTDGLTQEDISKPETLEKSVNTDTHYLSIKKWHSAEWKTDRKPSKDKAPRAHTAPSRFKPITTLYHDYDTNKKYQYTVP